MRILGQLRFVLIVLAPKNESGIQCVGGSAGEVALGELREFTPHWVIPDVQFLIPAALGPSALRSQGAHRVLRVRMCEVWPEGRERASNILGVM